MSNGSRRIIRSFKAKADQKRSWAEKFADAMTSVFGSVAFLFFNAIVFVVWIVFNMDFFLGLKSFDPFPFGLLTMIVSLEAIFLSIVVLISQNRSQKIDEVREEVDLQVDMITEQELTKLMNMVALLMEKQGIDIKSDKELAHMLKATNVEKIEAAMAREVVGE